MSLSDIPIQIDVVDPQTHKIADIWRRWFNQAALAISVSAPVDAQYLVATANSTLTAPRNLGLLGAGHLSMTVALGVATPTSSATIPSADLSGALPAISGAALTGLTQAQVSGSAPLASPTFTGVPAAPTAAPATSTTQLATTAFVAAAARTLVAPVTLKGYTVATLPAGVVGDLAYATDLLLPAFLAAAVGGGAVVGPVFFNGGVWVSI